MTETKPVYDLIGQEIHVGDTIVYALTTGGTALSVFKVLGIVHKEWFDGRASLQVKPIDGAHRTASGRISSKVRGCDFPRNALVITGTDLEQKVLAHFESVMRRENGEVEL